MTNVIEQQVWETITFFADDGHELRGRWFEPVGDARGVVLIVPAMATTASYYSTFASWLRDRGFAVMTFDYRGYGESADRPLREVGNDLVRWALDARDALEHAHDRAAGRPVTWLGHSLGGQVLPFADHTKADRAVSVAAGTGYWRHNTAGTRRKAPLLWKVIAPTAIAVTGYFPGKRLRMLGDLPPNVMRQWARWCMHPDYLLGELPEMRERFTAVDLPMASLSFTDDELMSATSIGTLDGLYTAVDTTRVRHTPQQLGVERVGHFGFFRHNQVDLWDELVLPHLAQQRSA
ncbi:alpha/beta fold hydrolase [Aeromicrobium sp. NPDC092404]|uniref:alpha/beta hydrolase family protein n=1 Tax=Aeromicrobium sp. NPDC092404 TaxID=3154976 RepID=UPI0034421088